MARDHAQLEYEHSGYIRRNVGSKYSSLNRENDNLSTHSITTEQHRCHKPTCNRNGANYLYKLLQILLQLQQPQPTQPTTPATGRTSTQSP